MSFEQLADREYARNVGRETPDACWVLSDRDVWYRNPFYTGPVQPHPEDDRWGEEDEDTCLRCDHKLTTEQDVQTGICANCWTDADELDGPAHGFRDITEDDLDELPF